MSVAPAVRAAGLGKYYGAAWAVRGVSLELQQGEALALLGPNGAGKSTLIRLLATLLAPSSGELRILGLDPARQARLVRARLGVLAHQSYLYAELSCAENLALYARLYGVAEAAIGPALDEVGLRQAADRRVRELSRGMQQRLALARATLHRPALLLLDEPDSGLDQAGRETLAALLERGRAVGQAVVLATHNMELALGICDRAVILARGRQAYSAPAAAHSAAEWRVVYRRACGEGG